MVGDLSAMIELYEALVHGETDSGATTESEGDEPLGIDFEDATRFRMHKRIERNASLSKKVKRLQGYTCKVCGLNFEARYGSLGKGYIEAHHLKPLATLKGKKIAMDPVSDFVVLCSNCHRMVHRSGCLDDVQTFKDRHYLK